MKIRVGCVQQRTRIYPTEEAFHEAVFSLAHELAAAGCKLVAFPEGVGAMLAPLFMPKPLVRVLMTAYNEDAVMGGWRANGKRLLGRFVDTVSAGQDLAATFNGVLASHGAELRDAYVRVFSRVARECGLYVVAGSSYVPDEATGRIVNAAYVFDPEGATLGYQNKVHLYVEDEHICTPGDAIRVFATEFGGIAVPICYEGMFPEVARIMVQRGARALINVSACPGERCFTKIRAGAWSRVQDNQVFGMHSCLVGRNDLSKEFTEPYRGRSSILAPIDYTDDYSGILAEAVDLDAAALITADWDFAKLDEVVAASDTPVSQDVQWDLIERWHNQNSERFAVPGTLEKNGCVPGTDPPGRGSRKREKDTPQRSFKERSKTY